MFWSRDRVAFELTTCSKVTRLVEVPVAERAARAERPGALGVTGTVNLDAAEVRALFEGTALDRARRRAPPKLLRVQFAIIFGRSCEEQRGEAPHYRAAVQQRQVGLALTHPIVLDALKDQPQWVLLIAARETDPERQIEAAVRARVDKLVTRTLGG